MVVGYLENASVNYVGVPMSSISGSDMEGCVKLSYNDVPDDLQIFLATGPVRRYIEPMIRYLSTIVDANTDVAFGSMVENFLRYAVHEHPELEPIAKSLQLGERPYRDPNLYRTDSPPRTSFPDYARKNAADVAIENIIEITEGIVDESSPPPVFIRPPLDQVKSWKAIPE